MSLDESMDGQSLYRCHEGRSQVPKLMGCARRWIMYGVTVRVDMRRQTELRARRALVCDHHHSDSALSINTFSISGLHVFEVAQEPMRQTCRGYGTLKSKSCP